jgi:hypothetical protein
VYGGGVGGWGGEIYREARCTPDAHTSVFFGLPCDIYMYVYVGFELDLKLL